MRAKLESIQALRGIAVLLVVFIHLFAFEPKASVGNRLLPDFFVFGASGVDLFFVISGFVMVYTTSNVSPTLGSVRSFLIKRITRIYPLYWLYTGVFLAGYSLFPQMAGRSDLAGIGLIESLLLLPQAQLPFLVVGWTLTHEMYFYLIFAVQLLLPRSYLPAGLGFWLFVLLLYSALEANAGLPAHTPFFSLIMHPLTLEFILGCLAGFFVCRGYRRGATAAVFLGLLSLLLGWSLHFIWNGGNELAGWTRALILGVPYTLIVFGSVARETNTSTAYPRLLRRIGDASYSIYLSHFMVLSVLSRVFAGLFEYLQFSATSYLDNLIFVMLSLAISIAFGILSFDLLEKPLLTLSRRVVKQAARRQDSSCSGTANHRGNRTKEEIKVCP